MGTYLLAGPFPLLHTPEGEPGNFGDIWAWWPHSGLMITTPFLCRAALDGIAEDVGGFFFWGPFGWWPARKRAVAMYAGKEYQIEPKGMLAQPVHPDEQKEIEHPDAQWALLTHNYIKLADRRVYYDAGWMYQILPGQPPRRDSEIRSPLPWIGGTACPGRTEAEVMIAGGDGCVRYNTDKREFDTKIYMLGMWSHRVVYAPEHDIFISEHFESYPNPEDWPANLTKLIRIWSTEVEPTALSAPTIFEGTATSGQVVTYRVQATGTSTAFNTPPDAAEGELIDWTLEGAGTLLDIQSKTDKNGYATTRVMYGLDETGESIVTASLTC